MKRSPLITVVYVLQFLLGLVLAGLSVFVLTLTRSQEMLADPDAADTVHGLLIGALVLGIPALITLIAAWGLCKGKLWGWVLSLATDVGVLAVFTYDILDEHSHEGSDIALAVSFVVPLVLLLLPQVRRFYWSASTTNLSS
ncbi:MAG: hypothetical protein HY010_19090 [Acidobacteria bacterium]|nr:hypothetical protein [Acidobacteriota bacterium]